MRIKAVGLCLAILIGAGLCAAQNAPAPVVRQPDYSTVYCSGFVTDQKVPTDMHVISGEQSNYKITFSQGEYIYIDRGMNQGVRVGDEFSVLRVTKDDVKIKWFKWQNELLRKMGTAYEDEGRIKVVSVHAKVSIAKVVFACNYLQRGDIIRPFEERPAPPFKDPAAFDHFAPPSGKSVAMVVTMSNFQEAGGANQTAYVNLGSAQGVKVGEYFRFFRHQGTRSETVNLERDFQYKLFGFGSTPQRYGWNDLPREVLGEGIVLNVSRNSSTVLITLSTVPVYSGDYAEIE